MRKLNLLAALAVALCTSPLAAEEKIVNVFNWSDYIDETVLEAFTKETGIKVRYDVFDSNEVVSTKVLTGNSGYDVIVPTSSTLNRLIAAGAIEPLDKTKIPNLSGLDPIVMARVAKEDAENKHGVPYMWAPNAIGVNVREVEKRLGGPAPASFDILLKAEYSDKLAGCGIYILDSADDIIPMALNWLGKDPNSTDKADLKAADDAMRPIRKSIRKFTSGEYIGPLANGDICVAIGYGGDLFQARARAKEANRGVVIDVLIPEEGTQIAVDTFGIPKDAKHKEEAHAFINFMLRPDIAAKNSNFISYATPVLAAKPLIEPEIANNPSIFPTPEVLAKTYTVLPKAVREMRLLTRQWTRFKSGD